MSLVKILSDQGMDALGRYYSIYEGIVTDNYDPRGLNRLKVVCTGISGGVMFWAWPRGQFGGFTDTFKHLSPRIGDLVYITFMDGDVSEPLWEYHGASKPEYNPVLNEPQMMGFHTRNNNFVILNDDTGDLRAGFGGNTQIISKGKYSIDGKEGLVLGEGNEGGLIIIAKLTEKINGLVNEIEALKAQINSHTHGTNAGPTTPPVTPITQTITPFNQSDYEDTHTIH